MHNNMNKFLILQVCRRKFQSFSLQKLKMQPQYNEAAFYPHISSFLTENLHNCIYILSQHVSARGVH